MKHKNNKGFTLVELLVIIGIIGILFAVILIAVDPAKRFNEARNAVRRQDVRDIVEASLEYMVDNKGNFPSGIDSLTSSYQILGTASSGCSENSSDDCDSISASYIVDACLDLSGDLVETYLADIPQDPTSGAAANTRYAINKTTGSRIHVVACDPEEGVSTIEAKR